MLINIISVLPSPPIFCCSNMSLKLPSLNCLSSSINLLNKQSRTFIYATTKLAKLIWQSRTLPCNTVRYSKDSIDCTNSPKNRPEHSWIKLIFFWGTVYFNAVSLILVSRIFFQSRSFCTISRVLLMMAGLMLLKVDVSKMNLTVSGISLGLLCAETDLPFRKDTWSRSIVSVRLPSRTIHFSNWLLTGLFDLRDSLASS